MGIGNLSKVVMEAADRWRIMCRNLYNRKRCDEQDSALSSLLDCIVLPQGPSTPPQLAPVPHAQTIPTRVYTLYSPRGRFLHICITDTAPNDNLTKRDYTICTFLYLSQVGVSTTMGLNLVYVATDSIAFLSQIDCRLAER